MKLKLIKTEAENEAALARLDAIFEAEPGTPEGDEAELLTALIEMYEEKAYPMDLPSPVDAIKFRMEQQGLKARDLIPYIGSASKVSEVLAGKRALSLSMIRNLVKLGIPAEVLLQKEGAALPSDALLQQGRLFPLAEMVKRRWFPDFQGSLTDAKEQCEGLLNRFFGDLGPNACIPALNRQHVRDGGHHDDYALMAWRIRVANLALAERLPATYKPGTVTEGFLRELAHLSYLESGPLLAREFLNKNGIHVILERHLPKTHLDGAAIKLPDGSPVVALTLRHDRLDNFWFTLFHELAHVALHLDQDGMDVFFDDMTEEGGKDKCEKEADKLASEALIPEAEWKLAQLTNNSSSESVLAFAERLRISPAIPAGRIRHESKDYKILKPLISTGKLRAMFRIQGKDPVLGQFLSFLAKDLADHPEHLQAIDAKFVQRIQSLVGDIEVDFDGALSADDE
ncbi:HTH-type transcriptional regulator / antitoxin HigA [Gammaproteobacteria bacterium]